MVRVCVEDNVVRRYLNDGCVIHKRNRLSGLGQCYIDVTT